MGWFSGSKDPVEQEIKALMTAETRQQPPVPDYFRLDNEAHTASGQLAWTSRPARRAELLFLLGDGYWWKSWLHTEAFGVDPYSDEDPTPAADWIADSARMLWILAEAEQCRGQGTSVPLQSEAYFERFDDRTIELQRAVDHILDEYARGGRRRPLIRQMCRVWGDMTGGQATESPWCAGLRLPWWAL